MKLFCIPLLLATAGAGWLGLAPGVDAALAPERPASDECRATVQCTSRGTCIVTCYDDTGRELCRREIACDEDCESACKPSAGCGSAR